MAAPFRFLDRIDVLVGGSASVLATTRQLVLPGGDRPVTRAGGASRIPAADVRRHVLEVALDVVTERVRDGLVGALREHLDEVRAEYEMLGDDIPLANLLLFSFRDGDVDHALGDAVSAWDAMGGEACDMQRLANAVLAVPVADPDAVLARAGVGSADVDALVAEIRTAHTIADVSKRYPVIDAVLHRAELAEEGWTTRGLAACLLHGNIDPALVEEGVAYVLTDPDMVATGAELLGLAGDAAFLAWAEERLMTSTPQEDAAAVAEVLRLAGANAEGGDGPDDSSATPATAAGDDEGVPPAAQFALEVQALIDSGEAVFVEPTNDMAEARRRIGDHKIIVVPVPDTSRDVRGATGAFAVARKVITTQGVVLKDVASPRVASPIAAEASDLTRAVGAALAALYDHGCETDKAMAEALGVPKTTINQARHGRAPWAPEPAQTTALWGMLVRHLDPLVDARDDLMKALDP